MKKIFIYSMILSAFALATTKSDLEAAFALYDKNKDTKQLEKSLIEISKQPTDEYTIFANLQLAQLKLSQEKFADSKIYANKVINDKKAPTAAKSDAYKILLSVAIQTSQKAEKTKILNELEKLVPTDIEVGLIQYLDYIDAKNTKKAKDVYARITKALKTNEIAEVDTLFATTLMGEEKLTQAKEFVSKLIKSSDKKIQSTGYLLDAEINLGDNNIGNAEKSAKKAIDLTDSKDALALQTGIMIDLTQQKVKEAIEKTKKWMAIDTKDYLPYIYLIIEAEAVGDTKLANDTLALFKKAAGENSAKVYVTISSVALNTFSSPTLAIKYADLAIENKQNDGYLAKALALVQAGNFDEALKVLDKAKSLKVAQASELYDQIKKAKDKK